MTVLQLETVRMPVAPLGPESPLPPLRRNRNLSSEILASLPPPPDYPDRGAENIVLPYRMQDGYTRKKVARDVKVAVLENDYLRATFTPQFGGRLWSLFDKVDGREMLSANPVFQPCNLAIRNAWSSGGVEWNLGPGLLGHHVLTCEPVFAARVQADDGSPALRLYEWERSRQVPFQIDFMLPHDSRFLLLRVRVANPHQHVLAMYWWTNIAVPEEKGARVIAPATTALRHNYGDGSTYTIDVPIVDGVDQTYTVNAINAGDMYFDLPKGQRPWVACFNAQGKGFVHASTARLCGRKLFYWGQGAGGRHWQEWLADSKTAYIELQGGLDKTQGTFIPMPPGEVWEWVEAMGPLSVDPADVHGQWGKAIASVSRTLDSSLPQRKLEDLIESARPLSERAPVELLHQGHGWAALENCRREACRQSPLASAATPYPASTLNSQQEPWVELLKTGALPKQPPGQDPGSLMVQAEWRPLLEKSVQSGRGDHWLTWYHLGLMSYRQGDRPGAKAAWERSIALSPSPWAYRNLAEMALEDHDHDGAVESLLKAIDLTPDVRSLAIECAEAIGASGRDGMMETLLQKVSPAVRAEGRLRMLHAQSAMEHGDLGPIEKFFKAHAVITTVRENELSLSDLWYAWQTRLVAKKEGVAVSEELYRRVRRELQPPREYDYRMRRDPT